MNHEPNRVTVARHHVEMGRRIVDRQRQMIRLRRIRGQSTREFEATLGVFERTLRCFEDDLEWMLGKATERAEEPVPNLNVRAASR